VLAERIITDAANLTPRISLKLIVNKKNHQYKNTECGMYSIFMIINMLTNKMTLHDFTNRRISDEQMMQFRKKYFNGGNLKEVPEGPSDSF
jgi:hypothetical protein